MPIYHTESQQYLKFVARRKKERQESEKPLPGTTATAAVFIDEKVYRYLYEGKGERYEKICACGKHPIWVLRENTLWEINTAMSAHPYDDDGWVCIHFPESYQRELWFPVICPLGHHVGLTWNHFNKYSIIKNGDIKGILSDCHVPAFPSPPRLHLSLLSSSSSSAPSLYSFAHDPDK